MHATLRLPPPRCARSAGTARLAGSLRTTNQFHHRNLSPPRLLALRPALHRPSPPALLAALPSPQGVAAGKAKLEFVRAYYEFSPKSLYSDTRAAAAAPANCDKPSS